MDVSKLKTWANRHQRFVSKVRPLDVLDGYVYDGEEDYVYSPNDNFKEYVHVEK